MKGSFENMMLQMARRNSLGAVFSDFLEMTVCALSMGRKEERYLEIVGKYEKKEVNEFPKILGQLVIEMDDNGQGFKDVLGEFFTLHVTRGHNGQFFTPETITEFMAEIIGIDELEDGMKVNDCACGSGRTLLSAGKRNRNLLLFGADVDKNCAMMTAINMVLNGLKGEVAWMNTLSQEYYGGWWIERFPVPQLYEITREQCYQALTPPKIKEEISKPPIPDLPSLSFGDQLTLF